MAKDYKNLTAAEIKALAESFDMTPKQFMSSIKAAESMLKKNKGGPVYKKKMNMGGMMPTERNKVNPTTGMTMNKGGMSDLRKAGMFYGGGMSSKKSKG